MTRDTNHETSLPASRRQNEAHASQGWLDDSHLFARACACALLPLALALAPMGVAAPALTQGAQDLYITSLPPEDAAVLGTNRLGVHIEAAGVGPIDFSGVPTPVPGFPEWMGMDPTPLGPIVFVPVAGVPGQYLMGFLQHGVTMSVDWNQSEASFDGTNGFLDVSIAHSDLPGGGNTGDQTEDPTGPCVNISEVPRPGGRKGIRIEVEHNPECSVIFHQFFTQRVTWTDAAGNSGTCPFPLAGTGNNEQPCSPVDDRVYVDSSNTPLTPDGRYPAQPPSFQAGPPPTATTAMEDAPGLSDGPMANPEALRDAIEVHGGFWGNGVTSITVEFRFTTYALLFCPNQAPDIVAKVEWSSKRTYTFPRPAGGFEDGELGGPSPMPGEECGFPTSSPTTQLGSGQSMDPDHLEALAKYQGGSFEGAERDPDGW